MEVSNAFNCCAGHSVDTTLEQEDNLKHMAWATACQVAPKQALESGGHRWGRRDDGATQGNTSASANFCCGWHKWVRKLDATLAASGAWPGLAWTMATAVGSVSSPGGVCSRHTGAVQPAAGGDQI